MKVLKQISTMNKAAKLSDGSPFGYMVLIISILELVKIFTSDAMDEKIDKVITWLQTLNKFSASENEAINKRYNDIKNSI